MTVSRSQVLFRNFSRKYRIGSILNIDYLRNFIADIAAAIGYRIGSGNHNRAFACNLFGRLNGQVSGRGAVVSNGDSAQSEQFIRRSGNRISLQRSGIATIDGEGGNRAANHRILVIVNVDDLRHLFADVAARIRNRINAGDDSGAGSSRIGSNIHHEVSSIRARISECEAKALQSVRRGCHCRSIRSGASIHFIRNLIDRNGRSHAVEYLQALQVLFAHVSTSIHQGVITVDDNRTVAANHFTDIQLQIHRIGAVVINRQTCALQIARSCPSGRRVSEYTTIIGNRIQRTGNRRQFVIANRQRIRSGRRAVVGIGNADTENVGRVAVVGCDVDGCSFILGGGYACPCIVERGLTAGNFRRNILRADVRTEDFIRSYDGNFRHILGNSHVYSGGF